MNAGQQTVYATEKLDYENLVVYEEPVFQKPTRIIREEEPIKEYAYTESYYQPPPRVEEGEIVDLNDPYLIQMLTEDNRKARKELERNGGLNRQYDGNFSYLQDGSSLDWNKRPIKEPKKYEDEEDAPGLFWGFCVAPRKKKQSRKEEIYEYERPTGVSVYEGKTIKQGLNPEIRTEYIRNVNQNGLVPETRTEYIRNVNQNVTYLN